MTNRLFDKNYNDIIKRLELAGITPLIKIDDVKDALPLMGALPAMRSGCGLRPSVSPPPLSAV